ncbi:MAG TPA: UDP-N-acetylmuramate dehydrogenase [Candidatus Cottocaccamicrobium excrementipullorum]|nr:UDP-N-acetylmuramate dehydrogenase [Candidatus Cottocaccamicrobium excrementipullorum]
MSRQLYESLRSAVNGQVKENEPLKCHTTFRAGGPARYFVEPGNEKELAAVIQACRQADVPWFVLGNGSNLLVSDQGFPGTVIRIGKGFSAISREENQIQAGAGLLLSQIARRAWEEGLSGLEFAAGIPGSLGGAVVMNAGAYGFEMKDVLAKVRVLTPEGECVWIPAEELKFGYRTSCILQQKYVVLGAVFSLHPGERAKIRARMDELAALRRQKQPLEFPSAGSTFKRPEGYFAGKLIQDAGLRGFRIGDAQISEKHCGFVINRGEATAAEIMEVCRRVSDEVYRQFGVRLELELKTLGEFEPQK